MSDDRKIRAKIRAKVQPTTVISQDFSGAFQDQDLLPRLSRPGNSKFQNQGHSVVRDSAPVFIPTRVHHWLLGKTPFVPAGSGRCRPCPEIPEAQTGRPCLPVTLPGPSTGASIHQCVWMHRCRHRVVACLPGSIGLDTLTFLQKKLKQTDKALTALRRRAAQAQHPVTPTQPHVRCI